MDFPKKVKSALYFPLALPSVITFLLIKGADKAIIRKDLIRQEMDGHVMSNDSILHCAFFLFLLMVHQKAFRAVFYKRIGRMKHILNILLPQHSTCEIYGCKIGEGLRLFHGFNIIVNPKVKIGRNCSLHHEVTIGATEKGVPVLGDDVFVGVGAKIIGPVKIGNNVRIGAGAIVVDDVNDNSIVVSPKAYVLR